MAARIQVIPLIMLAVLAVGCGQPPREPDPVQTSPAAFRDGSPRDFLAAVFARYRNAASYHDRGVVRLSYEVEGRQESRIAPAHVWLDHDRLYVEAYDVCLWSDSEALTAWITDDFDSQVLLRPPLNRRPTVESLFSDAILAERISAGLAGPPPQLEWLFAGEPMKHLFHNQHRFDFGQTKSIDGRLCRSVRVLAGRTIQPAATTEVYQFWVDDRIGVIRRVDLPPVRLPPQPGNSTPAMSLSLELTDASFDRPKGEPELQPLPKSPVHVRRFVPLPPPEPPRILGSRPKAFQLTDAQQRFTVTNRGSDRELTVLVRFSGDPSSLTSMTSIGSWLGSMPQALRQRLRVAVVVDEGERVPNVNRIPIVRVSGQATLRALGMTSGSIVILDRQGKVAWTQPSISSAASQEGSAELVQLGAIIGDLLDGVDVAARIRQQWREQAMAYRRVLSQQSVSHK